MIIFFLEQTAEVKVMVDAKLLSERQLCTGGSAWRGQKVGNSFNTFNTPSYIKIILFKFKAKLKSESKMNKTPLSSVPYLKMYFSQAKF